MIAGIGCDLVKVSRFEKWIKTSLIERFFNKKEILMGSCSLQHLCEHYAVRFAAKEAFSKALGTGLTGFSLAEVYIKKNAYGKPFLYTEGKADEALKKLCGTNAKIHVSLSHEKEYAMAYVIIEQE